MFAFSSASSVSTGASPDGFSLPGFPNSDSSPADFISDDNCSLRGSVIDVPSDGPSTPNGQGVSAPAPSMVSILATCALDSIKPHLTRDNAFKAVDLAASTTSTVVRYTGYFAVGVVVVGCASYKAARDFYQWSQKKKDD